MNATEDEKWLGIMLYAKNIKNRLKEINNPTQEEKIRWAMELIQNAKDSLYSSTNTNQKEKIEISFEVAHDSNNETSEIVFSHNGAPFTLNSLRGLIYQLSQGKNNHKTTGKFGTGFLTSHVLSKTVEISGDIFNEKENKLNGFSITMCREGNNDEEIIQNMHTALKTYQQYEKTLNITKFKYPIKTKQSLQCVELGLTHLKKLISNILINCPQIECIHIIENQTDMHYSAKMIEQINESICLFNVYCNNVLKRFIVVKDNENEISITIEIKNDKFDIVPLDSDRESIFITFPLIGSNAHILPFVIDSPNFNPTTERNGLVLYGDPIKDGEQTEIGINRGIFMKSVFLFEKLIQFLNQNGCSNMYELSFGLNLTENPYKSFDMEWYQKEFLKKMREVLSSNVFVNTVSDNRILLKDACFPVNDIDDNHIHQFGSLSLTKKYYPNIISGMDCFLWRNKIWESTHFISIDDIIEKVQNDKSLLNEDKMTSLNEFFSFLSNYNKELFFKIPLVPDLNNNLKCLISNGNYLRKCQTVSNEMIQMLDSLNISWKSTHINKLIDSVDLPEDKMIDAENQIIEASKKEEKLNYNLMQFVLENNEKRKNMFDFVTEFNINKVSWNTPIFVKNINPAIWDFADNLVINKIIQTLGSFTNDAIKEKINLIAKFILEFSNHYKTDENAIYSTSIIPNANYSLDNLNDLYNKSSIFHDHLNPIMKQYFNIDFNNKIIHPQINQVIKSSRNEDITDFLQIINQKISDIDQEKQIKIAESVISLVPLNDGQTPYLIEQNQIFDLYQELVNPDLKQIIINEREYSVADWKNSNKIALSKIYQTIEETKTLINFRQKFSFNDEKSFDILNIIYKINFQENEKHKIIPNKNGTFKQKSHLLNNPGIPDDFFNIISVLEPESDLEQAIVHPKVAINDLKSFDAPSFYQRILQILIDTVENKDSNDELLKLFHKITNIDVTLQNESKDQQVIMEMLRNANALFIKNRIRELKTPQLYDFQRWPFELIQNAVDCIQNDNKYSNKNGTIEFEFLKNQVTFTHYGTPFTKENFVSLLYQYGGLKDENQSKIGRFGTGFLSTLVLSRIVHIQGDLISDLPDGEKKITGFEVSINRQGNTIDELKKGIDDMEQTKMIDLPIKRKTKFIFELPLDMDEKSSSFQAYEEGYKSLMENVSPVLIFNPSIKSIIIKSEDDCISYTRVKQNGSLQTIIQQSSEQTDMKSFIHCTKKDNFLYNDLLEKVITVHCLLEYGSEFNIIPSKSFLFLCFPMFGPKKFLSSAIFNSPDFEPEKERNDIILQTNDKIADSYESSINKFIITKALDAYKQCLNIAVDRNCCELFNACHGFRKYLSSCNFIKYNFYARMKAIILEFPLFEINLKEKREMKKYNEIILPSINDYSSFLNYDIQSTPEEKEMQKQIIYDEFYNLLSNFQINMKHLVKYEHCFEWLSILWNDFESKFSFNQFLKLFEKFNDLSELPYTGDESKELYIKRIISFIEKMKKCNNILESNKILINANGQFISKADVFKIDIPQIFIDMLNIVDFDFSSLTLHPEISHLYDNNLIKFNIFDISKAIQAIKNKINAENSLALMNFVIEDDEKRLSMYNYTRFFRNDLKDPISIILSPEEKEKYLNDLHEMFSRADENVKQYLINEIKTIDSKENAEYVVSFLEFLKTNISGDQYEKESIFPNQQYELLSPKDLHMDMIQNDDIKDILFELFHINLRKELILDSCKNFIKCDVWNLQNISQIIINAIDEQQEKLKENDEIEFFSIIFQHSIATDDVKRIADLIHFFLNKEIILENNKDETCCWSQSLTEKVTKMAIESICIFISEFTNIKDIKETEEDINMMYEKFPILYDFALKFNCINKIFPNSFGDLKTQEDIYIVYDTQIEEDILYDLIKFLIQLHKSHNIKGKIFHKSIHLEDENKKKLMTNFINLNWIVEAIISALYTWNDERENEDEMIGKCLGAHVRDENYIRSFSLDAFISYINKHEKLRIAFADGFTNLLKDSPYEIVQNLECLKRLIQSQKVLTELETFASKVEISKNVFTDDYSEPFLNEITLYKILEKSNTFSEVVWPNLSNEETSQSIELDGETYFVEMKENNYSILAKDSDNNKYYFFIKNNSSGLNLSNEQLNFVLNLQSFHEYFIFAIIDDSNKLHFEWPRKMNLIL